MNAGKLFNPLSVGLALACAVLAFVLLWQTQELGGAGAPPPEPGRPPVSAPPARAPGITRPPLAAFEEITARPLFVQGRQPPAEAAGAAQDLVSAAISELNLTLQGVILQPGRDMAVFRQEANGELLRMAPGESFQGWTLEALRPDLATLKRGDETAEFPLEVKTDIRPAGPVRPPARATARRAPPALIRPPRSMNRRLRQRTRI